MTRTPPPKGKKFRQRQRQHRQALPVAVPAAEITGAVPDAAVVPEPVTAIEQPAEALPAMALGVNELERYNRQKRIWGEEGQKKLSEARVTIVGADAGAKYAALPLAALGIGEMRLIGAGMPSEQERLLDLPLGEKSKVEGYKYALLKLNPTVELLSLAADLETRLAQDFLDDSTLIIEATNSPRSKALVFEYAQRSGCPVLSMGIGGKYAKLMLWQPGQKTELAHVMPQFAGQQQNPLLSLLWGGVAAEEAKKLILGDAAVLRRELYYTVGHQNRFTFPPPPPPGANGVDGTNRANGTAQRPFETAPYVGKSALVVGAGALGNIMCIALAEMGFGQVDYLDYDTIESHNLNRQVLFYDAVGLAKAEVLARKHTAMQPNARSRGLVEKLEIKDKEYSIEKIGLPGGYDIVFDLVDNLYARALLSAYAVQHDMPLVSAASSPDAAQVAVYVPRVTSCLNHVFNGYYEKGVQEEIVRRQSCIAQPDPSVIMTNQIGAALAALEACLIFEPHYGTPFNGSVKYAAALESRLGINPIKDVCDCYQHKEDVPNLELTDTKLEELKEDAPETNITHPRGQPEQAAAAGAGA